MKGERVYSFYLFLTSAIDVAVISFTVWLRMDPWCRLDRRLVGPHTWSGHMLFEINIYDRNEFVIFQWLCPMRPIAFVVLVCIMATFSFTQNLTNGRIKNSLVSTYIGNLLYLFL
jgi:hypothetical protein